LNFTELEDIMCTHNTCSLLECVHNWHYIADKYSLNKNHVSNGECLLKSPKYLEDCKKGLFIGRGCEKD
jgi:hypothetical protein